MFYVFVTFFSYVTFNCVGVTLLNIDFTTTLKVNAFN